MFNNLTFLRIYKPQDVRGTEVQEREQVKSECLYKEKKNTRRYKNMVSEGGSGQLRAAFHFTRRGGFLKLTPVKSGG